MALTISKSRQRPAAPAGGRRPAGRRPRSRAGYSLVEVLISFAILAFSATVAVSGMIYVRKTTIANNLRSVALFNAEQTLEVIRSMGREELLDHLKFNGVPSNGIDDVWEADAIAEGLAPAELILHSTYEPDQSGDYQERIGARRTLHQQVQLIAHGGSTERTEDVVRIYVDIEWESSQRVFRESLFTIIE